jgi:hypothetical protein
MSARVLVLVLVALATFAAGAWGEDTVPDESSQRLIRAANAPLSDILQFRIQDSFVPEFNDVPGQGNSVVASVTMPLPKYRLIPFPQLSLLTAPLAVTTPDGDTNAGDLRFLDVAILDTGHKVIFGVGPTLVFPSASDARVGQGKWQAGPAAAIAVAPEKWLFGALAANPISFAGDRDRPGANALILQPFVTYQLGGGWFLRSQPQMIFDWHGGTQLVPLDLGGGRLLRIGRRYVNCFVEPYWNVVHGERTPAYGVTFGIALLYPNFWQPQ